jgi:SAM-dependent methyltransferase
MCKCSTVLACMQSLALQSISMICPICSSALDATERVGTTQVLSCSACTVCVTRPEDRATGSSVYSTDYQLSAFSSASTERYRYFRFPEYQALVSHVLHALPRPTSWLDVGCDRGYFLDELRRRGIHVAGVEPSHEARTYATSIGLNVTDSLMRVDGTFDGLSLFHVLEHVAEPVPFLESCSEKIRTGGLLYVRVPDFTTVWRRIFGQQWIWFQPHLHALHYTPRALSLLLEQRGFELLWIRQQRPNTLQTRRAYRLANDVFARTGQDHRPRFRDRCARLYQDVTGIEIACLARKR